MLADLYKYSTGLVQGALATMRGDKTGALVVSAGHAPYQEAAIQGGLWSLSTAAAGVTVAAANVVAAANLQPLVGIANPAGSGYNLCIIRGVHVWNSGTAGAGGLVWTTCPANTLVTAAGGNGAISCLTQQLGGSRARTYVNSAMTGITGGVLFSYAGGPSAGAIAANSNQMYIDYVDGVIIVPPGAACGLAAAAAGTSPIVNATMFWEEVPI